MMGTYHQETPAVSWFLALLAHASHRRFEMNDVTHSFPADELSERSAIKQAESNGWVRFQFYTHDTTAEVYLSVILTEAGADIIKLLAL